MREHELEPSLRPKADRVVADEDGFLLGRAAVAGRPDVLGASGMLGLQRAVGNSSVSDVVSSGGSPLPSDVRADMEGRFGHSFADVRVHTSSAADASARSVNAQAYTVGSNIVFQRDKYDPSSAAGQHMLAHELTHVVQQRSGPVDGTDRGDGVRVSDPSDRFEREAVANADRVMQRCADEEPVQRVEAPASTEEEETAQTFVQRAEEEEEIAE